MMEDAIGNLMKRVKGLERKYESLDRQNQLLIIQLSKDGGLIQAHERRLNELSCSKKNHE